MPIISQFYGILVYLYKEIGGHHNKPHVHVKYNEYELYAAWYTYNDNGEIIKIKGVK